MLTVWAGPALAVGALVDAAAAAYPQTWISESPTLSVVELTAVTVRVTLVIVWAAKLRVRAEPSLGRLPVLRRAAVAEGQGGGGDLVVGVGAVVEDDLVDHHGGRPGELQPGAGP